MEVEHVEQIVQSRRVQRHIRIVLCRLRVGIIITTTSRQRAEMPVPLDEFRDRNVIAITVVDVTTERKGRHDDQRDSRTVTEEIQRLYVA